MIPQAAPFLRIARFPSEIDKAISRVLSGASYVLGPNVEAFEIEFASFCGVEHCVADASGTDALGLPRCWPSALQPATRLITTALTAPATAQAILHTGAVPCLVDVDPGYPWCIDPAAIADAITPRTTAIAPVHLFGHPCNMPKLMKVAERYGLLVVEDCAQSVGASHEGRKLGSFGHAAAYSFYPTKNLGCVGDGGAVVTADAKVAAKVRSLRNYGYGAADRVSRQIGFNSRLDVVTSLAYAVDDRGDATKAFNDFGAPLASPIIRGEPGCAIFSSLATAYARRPR